MISLLTSSRQESFLGCQRKHFWRYEIGLRHQTDAIQLRFGSAWHRAMEARWTGADYDNALAVAIIEGADLDEVQCATLAGLLAGYYAYYGAADNLVAQLHPEVEFNMPLRGSRSFAVAGKIDGLAVLHDNRLSLLEHKTTSDDVSPESDYWLRLRFNSQVLGYVLAARALGWAIELAVYDVTRKPAIEPKLIPVLDDQGRKIVLDANGQRVIKSNGEPRETGDKEKGYTLQTRIETAEEFGQRLADDTRARPEFYFARREIPILDQDLAAFEQQRLVISRQILSCRTTERKLTRREEAWPRNVDTFRCRNCEYSSFCLQNLTVDINNPPAGFSIGPVNPELNHDNSNSTVTAAA